MSLDPHVHVIDDDPHVLRSLSFLLTVHGIPTKTYGSATDFLEASVTGIGGCVLSDVRMPGMDGIELLRALRAGGSNLPYIVMTGHADIAMAIDAMKAGAMDFVEKPYSEAALTAMVALGLAQWREISEKGQKVTAARDRLALLTPRERQVLDAVAEGSASKAIAHALGLSVRTVEVHRANILSKLAVENALLAVAMLTEAREG